MSSPSLSITVADDAPTQETQSKPQPVRVLPKPLGPSAQQRYDEMRRPQAATLYRALMGKTSEGMSWKECWALGEGNDRWDVGPIVVWLRAHGVEVEARYDSVVGETRFYIA